MNRKSLAITMAGLFALLMGILGGVAVAAAGTGIFAPHSGQEKAGAEITASPLIAVGSGFTYQGRLSQAGNPSNGQYDMVFTLFDAPTGGIAVGTAITLTNQTVTGGLFNVELDFGSTAFLGDTRWLEIAVRPAGGGAYSTLLPRQPLTPAPYAQSAPWQGISSKPAPYNPLKSANSLVAADSTGTVGQGTSVTTGVDGLGLITYQNTFNADLKVAHCNNTACTSAWAFTLDSTGSVGLHSSITVGADGLGLISYFDNSNGDLKVAHCNNTTCTSASAFALESAGVVGHFTSIVVGADGLGLISYRDVSNADLKVAHCDNITCSSAFTFTLDNSAPILGEYTSVTVGADGLGLISYYDGSNGDLKVAHCNNVTCSSASTFTLDSTGNVGFFTSVTVGADGLGLISYFDNTNQDLKVAHCNNITCSSATTFTLDSTGNVGQHTSMTVGADGLGLISYYDLTNADLKVARCNNITCSSALTFTLDNSLGNVGLNTSVTMGADGLGLISYLDITNQNLKVAHCASPLCVSYARRR